MQYTGKLPVHQSLMLPTVQILDQVAAVVVAEAIAVLRKDTTEKVNAKGRIFMAVTAEMEVRADLGLTERTEEVARTIPRCHHKIIV